MGASWVRKVWVFGDRPIFLFKNRELGGHIPHKSIAWIGQHRTPMTNLFLTLFLASLLPELDEEYLFFSDDFVLLDDLSPEKARQVRYLQNLNEAKSRGRGMWKDALWRTYDTLKRLGYVGYNFETHTPTYLRKRWVLGAFHDLQDYVTEDRFYGLFGPTAILNHVYHRYQVPLVNIHEEASRAGFYGTPAAYEEIVEKVAGRLFLNFDDEAFGDGIRQFLREKFPSPCKYERTER